MFNWFKNFFSSFEFNLFGTHSDVSGYEYNDIMNQDINDGFKRDREALASDWKAIGGDFRRVIKKSK